MSIVYKSNEQVLIEIKKVMLETKTTQREIADKLGIKPQGLTKILNKKSIIKGLTNNPKKVILISSNEGQHSREVRKAPILQAIYS